MGKNRRNGGVGGHAATTNPNGSRGGRRPRHRSTTKAASEELYIFYSNRTSKEQDELLNLGSCSRVREQLELIMERKGLCDLCRHNVRKDCENFLKQSCDQPKRRELRFHIGQRVLCSYEEAWELGTVLQHYYRESEWIQNRIAPYRIELDNGRLIYAPLDDDRVIRAASSSKKEKEEEEEEEKKREDIPGPCYISMKEE